MGKVDVASPARSRNMQASGLLLGATLVALVAWEVNRPSLLLPFELVGTEGPAFAAPWVRRIPAALASAAGLCGLCLFLTRTINPRVALYSTLILSTLPAWFVHCRTASGAMLTMGCSAVVLAGAGLAALDTRATLRSQALCVTVTAAAAVLGTRYGVPNRGLLTVAGVPLLSVGMASFLLETHRTRGVGTASIGVGLVIATSSAAIALGCPDGRIADFVLGARGGMNVGGFAFDAPVGALAYELVPWTPLVPIALSRRPKSAGHLALILAGSLSIVAHAALAPRVGATPLVGIASIAGAIGTMTHALDDTRRPSVALIATVAVVGWLVAHDVGLFPGRSLVAVIASNTPLLAGLKAEAAMAVRVSLAAFTSLTLCALVAPVRWLPAGRGFCIVVAGAVTGLGLRLHTVPRVLAAISPSAAVDAWLERRGQGDSLGVVGVESRAIAVATQASVLSMDGGPAAGRWLAAAPASVAAPSTRFLALATSELPAVNAEYRAALGHNVPIVAGEKGAILLGASRLSLGERSTNPLDAVVLDHEPPDLTPLGSVLGEHIEAVGWQIRNGDGTVVSNLSKGPHAGHIRLVFRMRGRVDLRGSTYCSFLHIDHLPTRFAVEHREFAYPMHLWGNGDLLIEDFNIHLSAHFLAGRYKIFWGLGVIPCEDDRRMPITSGASDGQGRIPAGFIEIQ